MNEVSSAGGGSFYGAEVRLGDQDMATGRVSFGGVSISATDAAEFVMMHRTEVLKQVGADRTELAEKTPCGYPQGPALHQRSHRAEEVRQ